MRKVQTNCGGVPRLAGGARVPRPGRACDFPPFRGRGALSDPVFPDSAFSQQDGHDVVPHGAGSPRQRMAHADSYSNPQYRGGRRGRTGLRTGLVLSAVFAGLLGCFLFAGLSGFGRNVSTYGVNSHGIDGLGRALGLGIDQVGLRGYERTPDGDIFDALQLEKSKSFLSFDADGALERIRRLPRVKTASIDRVFPGRLEVRIEERSAFAVWQVDDAFFLIDETGHVLGQTDGNKRHDLPLVVGHGAPAETALLMRLVGGSPVVADAFRLARRVSGRRWTIELTTGATLLLPAEGEASALALVSKAGALKAALLERGAVVDMRAENGIGVLRKAGSRGRSAQRVAFGGGRTSSRDGGR